MGHPIFCGRARNTRLPFDLSLVFITLGEPQAHGDTAEPVPFHDLDTTGLTCCEAQFAHDL
jgi:hypothetical protein